MSNTTLLSATPHKAFLTETEIFLAFFLKTIKIISFYKKTVFLAGGDTLSR